MNTNNKIGWNLSYHMSDTWTVIDNVLNPISYI